jgi:diaminopimelate decarboxylase
VNAHPAGPRHAEEFHHGGVPPCPQTAQELLELAPNVWPRNAVRGDDGVVSIAGVSLPSLALEYGTPLFVVDEDDFRSRCREIAAAFGGGANVHYAGKAFLSSEIARWIDEEGLSLDVCTGGELAVALHADFPPERIALHGNNKSPAELTAAVKAGIAHVVVDSMIEIERLDAIAGEAGIVQDVLVRVTVGVEAHTHEFISTAHEDQKFGLSLANGAAMDAVRRVFASDHLRLVGLHSHIGSQIFDVGGFEIAAHRVIGLLRDVVAEFGVDKTSQIATVDLGGGLGISYLPNDDPPPVMRTRRQARLHRAQRVRGGGLAGSATGRRTRARHRRTGDHHPLRGRHRQRRRRQRDSAPALRQRGRRHERQHPHLVVRRRLRRATGLPGHRRDIDAGPCGRKALREWRYRGPGYLGTQ